MTKHEIVCIRRNGHSIRNTEGATMAYQVQIFDGEGRHTQTLGPFGNVPSARQAMLDHSNTINLPTEEPFATDYLGGTVTEGWFIGRTEYNICRAR